MSELRRLPGASYRGSNAFIVAQRKILNLQDPFEMNFDNWKAGNRLYDWYHGLSNRYIQTMHLRKERDSPFYHEFIVFRLRGDRTDRETFWRIDRRQLPDEETPIDCIFKEGVPARDTIEQVTSLDPRLYSSSDCMVELEFQPDVNVDVGLVLKICREIKMHKHTKVYTLQRYNCFFFAQALILCTACGVSDWAGLGEARDNRDGPWKTPNTAYTIESGINNASRRAAFKWNPTDDFNHDWSQLSQLSNNLIHASPLLRHADHCNSCLESQVKHRQRSMSSEINRLKRNLVEHWNASYRQLLHEVYSMNHAKFVASGVWGIIEENRSGEDSKVLLDEKIGAIEQEWNDYSQQAFLNLLETVRYLVDPKDACDAWYRDPDEWGSKWACIDGGPVVAAMEEWEKATALFFQEEFPKLQKALEDQAIKSGTDIHTRAMKGRIESFKRSMIIKLRVPDETELAQVGGQDTSESALNADQLTVHTRKTKKTFMTRMSKLTTRAAQFRVQMRRLFKGSHKLEEADIMQMQGRIQEFIFKHSDRVETYRALLNCTAIEVREDMMGRMDEVWNSVIL